MRADCDGGKMTVGRFRFEKECFRVGSGRRPYGTPEPILGSAFPTLKRGANKLCAYGATTEAPHHFALAQHYLA